MPEYKAHEENHIRLLYESFNKKDIGYVIPRGYQTLPTAVLGSDIDIIVDPKDYKEAILVCEESGFEKVGTPSLRVAKLGYQALQNPKRAKQLLMSDRYHIVALILEALFGSRSDSDKLASQYKEHKSKRGNVVIHLMNHVAHKSPHNGQKVRVDPKVEEKLHTRSMWTNNISCPSPPDELAHLICRGVFDYYGDFPDYYIDRCEELKTNCFSDEEFLDQLEELFGLLFFDANELVMEHVKRGRYDSIKSALIQFDGY